MGTLSVGFTVADIITNMQPMFDIMKPFLPFVIGIPLAFYVAHKIKGLFASRRTA